MGGRGAASNTEYQGTKGYAKARGTGNTVDKMATKISELSPKVQADNEEAIAVIRSVQGNPNASITIYRATIGKGINKGDWVFLDKKHADKWTKTAFGTPKPGVVVRTKKVKAKDVDWTGKNLEFMYKGR